LSKRDKKLDITMLAARSNDFIHLYSISPARISVFPKPDTCPKELVIRDAIVLCAQTRADVEVLFEDGAKLLQYAEIVNLLMGSESV